MLRDASVGMKAFLLDDFTVGLTVVMMYLILTFPFRR